jgi:drug/metabolite transporter (DMT)-like permease
MNKFLKKKSGVACVALLYTLLWSLAFPLIKLCMSELAVVRDLDKCLLAGIRFTVSGAVLSAYAGMREKRALPQKRDAFTVIGYGSLGTALQYACTFIGLSRVGGGVGAIFDQLCVFFIILLGGIFLRNDSLTWKKVLGCAVGFVGVLAVNTEPTGFAFSFLGEGMMIIAALCQTGAYFIAAKSADRLSAVRLVGNGQLIGGALLLAVSLCLGANIPKISLAGLLLLLALAAISAAAYVLSLMPLRYFPASEVSVYNLLIPVFGVLMSGLILREDILKWNYPVSLALICVGIILVNLKGKKNGKNI